jgi:glutaredoxin 3
VTEPTLFVKKGCPYCAAAMKALDERGVAYEKVDVRGDEDAMNRLSKISGQTRTPTLAWDGNVLADFDVDQLDSFLAKQKGKG